MNFSARTWRFNCAVGMGCAVGAVLFGCGGSDAPSFSVSLSTPKYSQPLLLTVNNISSPVAVTATGCTGLALSTTAPYVSTATTAYYQCTASTLGAGQFVVTRVADAAVLSTQPFTVPIPQVTLTFSNGAAVNGSMVFTLAPAQAPISVTNFLNYVNTGFYPGTVIHRVSPNFVIQGGGFAAPVSDATATLKPTNPPIALEVGVGLSNLQWTVAMARTSDPNSATSQFFINLVDNTSLDTLSGGYAVFGSVTTNTALVTQIAAAPCVAIKGFTSPGECIPVPNVVITAASQTQ